MESFGGGSSSNSLKHYKKSMIHEYENKAVGHEDDGLVGKKKQSSTSESESSEGNKSVYCVCRSSDTQRFMIGCDKCDEWYHGDCVGLSESFTNNIKTFYCYLCRFKNSQLNIRYKKKTERELRERYWKDFNKWEHKEHDLLKKVGLVSSEASKPSSNKPHVPAKQKESSVQNTSVNQTKSVDIDSKLNLIRNTISKEDVEHFVSAIFQFGTENTASPLLSNASLLADLSLATASSSVNHHFLPQHLAPSSPSSSTTSSLNKLSRSPKTTNEQHENHGVKRQFKEEKARERHHQLSEDDEDDDNEDSTSYEPRSKKKRVRKKKNEPESTSSSVNISSKKPTIAVKTKSNDRLVTSESHLHPRHKHHHRHRQNSDDGNDVDSIRQCLGPSCIEVARNGSKYCSDECGIKLAKKRLVSFFNEKKDGEVKAPTVADELNESQLKKIEEDVSASKQRLNEIEKDHVELDSIIEKAKTKKINEGTDNDRDIEETEIYCVTCGQSCSERQALKHMEKCFNKYESKAFFGSVFKSHPEGQTIFCDYYNSQTKMYCKRLKVICPEHEKEKKVNEDEVCGCPLYKKNNLLQDSDDICLQSKRNCQFHFKWEKLRRAQLDLEKLRLLMKLDELYEQKKMIESAMSNRSGLLGVLLHKTIKHGD